jgi:hypothetical protein
LQEKIRIIYVLTAPTAKPTRVLRDYVVHKLLGWQGETNVVNVWHIFRRLTLRPATGTASRARPGHHFRQRHNPKELPAFS